MKELVYLIQTPPLWTKTPPLSVAYLSSYLHHKKIKTKTIDLNYRLFKALSCSEKKWLALDINFENNLFGFVNKNYPCFFSELYKKIEKSDFIGLSLFKRNLAFSISLAEKIKEKFPKKKLIFGGPQVKLLRNNNTKKHLGYWISGEGEIPIHKIISKNENIYEYESVEIDNLDTLPFYDFHQLKQDKTYRYLPLLTSRGCPFKCKFCSERTIYKKFRNHSPEYMIGQIRHLKQKYKTNNFVFSDSLINYNKNWLLKLCKLILKDNLNINWEAQIRVDDTLPLLLAKIMKKSGCYNLFVGLESGSEKVLKLMDKGFTPNQALKFFKILNQAELHFEISLIFGYPGEKEKNFSQTINFITANKKYIPKIAQVNPYTDYLGNFPEFKVSNKKTKDKIHKFISLLESQNLKYTKNFINNLIYPN